MDVHGCDRSHFRMDDRTFKAQVGVLIREHVELLADILVRAVIDARDQFLIVDNDADEMDDALFWIESVFSVLEDVVILWPLRTNTLRDVIEYLETQETKHHEWGKMRKGISKYIRAQPQSSELGDHKWLRRWAKRVKEESLT